jgi:cardiolipin synthase A/B
VIRRSYAALRRWLARPHRTLWRLAKRGLALLLGAQTLVISALLAIDAWRKRFRSQGSFPRTEPRTEAVAESEVEVYTYGEDLYAAMLDAIEQARERVCFETFIWKGDRVGQQFKDALIRAAARGVAVYVIYDAFANLVVPPAFKRFPRALHVLRYPLLPWPFNPFHLRSYARDHRKILVVDGTTAFCGGYNIGSRYATDWRDTHLRVTGPSAWELENAFVDFWNAHRPRRLPPIPERSARTWEPRINVHRNDPPMLMFPIRSMYLEAIDRAQHHIFMTHAYFTPDRVVLRALLQAAQRGVDVRIILPETSNHVVVDWLARSYYTECLQAGVKLLLYQNAMVHAKTATIDGIWSTIGTANMDRLSMAGNFEVNIELYDRTVAQHMEQIFHVDSDNTRSLSLAEWQRRPLLEKLAEAILMPLRPLL